MRNACGSIALLNLVMNIPNVELGKHINRFRNSTKDMSPNQRGKAVAEFAFVRQAHNSWARKSDMMNEDKLLRENVLKKNQYKKRGTTARPSRKKKKDEYENAYHYIAYMPANGEIWRMDGMEKSAESFGSYSEETWLAQVVSVLQERMELLVNQGIQFNVLAMTKDPLLNIRTDLAQNIKSISALESRLEEVQPSLRGPVTNGHEINAQDQRSLTPDSLSKSEKGVEKYSEADTINGDTAMTKEGSPESPYPLRGPVPLYGIDSSMIENLGALLRACHILENDPNPAPATLLRLYRDLAADQAKLRDAYMDEESKQRSEEKKAEARRWDYVPLVRQWVKYLAEAEDLDTGKPVLDELIKQDKEDEEKMDVDDSRSASNFSKSASPKGLMRRGG